MEQLTLIPTNPEYFFFVDRANKLHIVDTRPALKPSEKMVLEGALSIRVFPHCKQIYIGSVKLASIHAMQTNLHTDMFKPYENYGLIDFLSALRMNKCT